MSKKKILIVDDEAGIRDVFSEILQEEGYSIKTASNGIDALTCLDSETFDLILLDKKMPLSGGMNFVEKARGKNIPSKILLITGSPTDTGAQGVDGSLLKPCGVDELISAVKKLLPD
jgi:CheY-like chemotaxis protein